MGKKYNYKQSDSYVRGSDFGGAALSEKRRDWLSKRSDILQENIDSMHDNYEWTDYGLGSRPQNLPAGRKSSLLEFAKYAFGSYSFDKNSKPTVDDEIDRQISRVKQAGTRNLGKINVPKGALASYYYPLDIVSYDIKSIESNKQGVDINSVISHELGHAQNAIYQEHKIKDITEEYNEYDYLDTGITPDPSYLDSPSEIYARVSDFRDNNNIDPKRVFTLEDIKNYRKDLKAEVFSPGYVQYTEEELENRAREIELNMRKAKKAGEDDMRYQEELHIINKALEIKRTPNAINPASDSYKGMELFNRYKPEFLLKIFNEVASTDEGPEKPDSFMGVVEPNYV